MSKGIRQGRVRDAREIARIEVETWRDAYAGMLPDKVLLGMSLDRQAGLWTARLPGSGADIRVAEGRRGGLVGFGQCGPQRISGLDFAGEIYTLYVQSDAQGAGIGRRLLSSLFGRLVDLGHNSAIAWVIDANPARYFYERVGGRLVCHRRFPIGGQEVDALGFGWGDLPAMLDRVARFDDGLPSGPGTD